jgi:hypothetical protein
VERVSEASAFLGAGAIPATERNSIVNSHGDVWRKYVFLHIANQVPDESVPMGLQTKSKSGGRRGETAAPIKRRQLGDTL